MTERRSHSPTSPSSQMKANNPLVSLTERKKFELEASEVDDAGGGNNFDLLLKHRARQPSLLHHLPPPKTTLAAVGMLLVGSVFLILGITTFLTSLMGTKAEDRNRGLAMVVLGSLMFIPGSYASCVLYGAYRGWPGYEYNQIPSYDED